MILLISICFIAGASLFYFLSFWLRRSSRIPGGATIFIDSHNWRSQERPLFDHKVGLTGKPDYIIKSGRLEIPVEVKSNPIYTNPYESHIMQLAAYCRLTHIASGKRPPYGILKYANKTIEIKYTHELESKLLHQVESMQFAVAKNNELHRSHNSIAKCNGCSFTHICDERLM